MISTDTFFADLEQFIATLTPHDRVRAEQINVELAHIYAKVPRLQPRCLAYKARISAKLADYDQALAFIEEALRLAPNDDSLALLRADIHRQAQSFAAALEEYDAILAARPESVTARLRRAETRQSQGQLPAALDDINLALQQEPRWLQLIYRRALILVEMRRPIDAIADFKTVARLATDAELKHKALQRLRELGEG